MHHSLFNHPYTNGHLGCLQYFAFTNNAAMKNCVYVVSYLYFPSKFPEAVLLGQIVNA